ncbi:MAG: tubulin-like doman-containing protein, partial [Planctomycetota bacterium]
MKTMQEQVQLLVGCGGTGIKTMKRVVELMSQDQKWRHKMSTHVYFIVIDTEQKDTQDFIRAVDQCLRGKARKPHIVSINLSQSARILQPDVHRYMRADETDPSRFAGRDRLLQHWWHRNETSPYTAPSIDNITEGAGQCSPVSYFLTWMRMRSIEDKLRKLYETIQNEVGGIGSWGILNTMIVAGLAGGTGRGSWELLGFKLRDVMARMNHQVAPQVFLVDQSAFKDIQDRRSSQQLPMKMNALTGFSQLSAWIENRDHGRSRLEDAQSFRLPSMLSPENEESDAINLNLRTNVNDCAPVNNAFLVFRSNGQSTLGLASRYFEMIGAGIYSALSRSDIARTA